jgi:hypothetical protein
LKFIWDCLHRQLAVVLLSFGIYLGLFTPTTGGCFIVPSGFVTQIRSPGLQAWDKKIDF